jgi:hypothetical protein
MPHAIKAEHYPLEQHPAYSRSRRRIRTRDLAQTLVQLIDNAIDPSQRDFFFAAEMQVKGAFADADLEREVIHRHLSISVTGQEPVCGIDNQIANVFSGSDCSHGDMTNDHNHFLVK